MTVSISNGTVTDAQGTPNTESSKLVHIVDIVPPVVSDGNAPDATTISLVMSEPVFENAVEPSDFAVTKVASNPVVELDYGRWRNGGFEPEWNYSRY